MNYFSALQNLGEASPEDSSDKKKKDGKSESNKKENQPQRPSSSANKKGKGNDKGKVPKKLQQPLVWVDLEMTGLDLEKDTVLEIAVILTNGKLSSMVEGPEIAIHHPDAVLADMNEWSQEHHEKSGLTQRCRESKVSMEQAEQQVLDFVSKYTKAGMAVLAGSSVHVDRQFLLKCMPRFAEHLTYRIVDVSSFKEMCKRWFPREFESMPKKKLAHTALSDIKESIEELKWYKEHIFIERPY